MKAKPIWGEGKSKGKARKSLVCKFLKVKVFEKGFLEKVFLQTFLVLKLFQSFIVGSSKDVLPSLVEVVIAWHIQR